MVTTPRGSRVEVQASARRSYVGRAYHPDLATVNSGCGNTDSQHLLAEQQVAAMYPESNPARASAKGLQSFVLSVIRMMARLSTLEQLRQTMAAQTTIELRRTVVLRNL